MAKTYEEIMTRRLALVDPAVAALRPAFERIYDDAIAALDLRDAESAGPEGDDASVDLR